jgi:hypothetical protein
MHRHAYPSRPPSSPPNASASDLTLTADTPWIVSPDEPEPIQRALEDVKRDWYKVFGHLPVVLSSPPAEGWDGPLLHFGLAANTPSATDVVSSPVHGREAFVLGVRARANGRPVILATGADMRGAIYAAYAFSEEILGVDPWWFWTDKEPVFRTSIVVSASYNLPVAAPTFKHRGWFINDEDLLNGFSPDPLRETIFSNAMLDRICETLLRLRGNMLVPATFPFPDERCHELTARRGLIIAQHHILVMGLNTYQWPEEVPFSFTKHPEILERYWQTCVDALKDKEIVWSVGYRGKFDRPFWIDEPEIATPQARGEVISRAIAKQVEIIRRAQPDVAIIANMWEEGANLYRQGVITLPPGVTLVWPDDGTGLMRENGLAHILGVTGIRDAAARSSVHGAAAANHHTVAETEITAEPTRQPQAGQGMYYHTAMLSWWFNQLSEMVPPARIYQELGRFIRAGATEYFLLNLSDVRPVPLGTDCAMKLAWDATPYRDHTDAENQATFLLDWCRRQYGAAIAPQVVALYAKYFDVPSHRPEVRQGEHAPHSYLKQLGVEVFPLLRAGHALTAKLNNDVTMRLTSSLANLDTLAPLLAEAQALVPSLPSERREFFQSHLVTALGIHLHGHEMLAAYCAALQCLQRQDHPGAEAQLVRALVAIDALFATLRLAEKGKWAAWYIGEHFVGIDLSRDQIRTQLALVRGETPPPIRPRRFYPELYKHQDAFQQNFPLMYPSAASRSQT